MNREQNVQECDATNISYLFKSSAYKKLYPFGTNACTTIERLLCRTTFIALVIY